MKKYLRKIFIIGSVILTICFIISCLASWIPPASFSYIGLFAFSFPLLFLLVLIVGVISLFIQKRLALFMLLSLIFSYKNIGSSFAFNKPAIWQQSKDSNTLRVMTWNVESFVDLSYQSNPKSKTRMRMLDIIQAYRPDIICIQEYKNVEHGKWRTSVQSELDSIGYPYFYPSNDFYIEIKGGRSVTGGVAIYSSIPMLDKGKVLIRNNISKENLIYSDFNLNKKPIRIYTAHLASFAFAGYMPAEALDEVVVIDSYDLRGSVLEKLKETDSFHQEEIEVVKKQFASNQLPFIFCGDLNTTPTSYNYFLLKESMQDAFLEKGLGMGATFYKILPWLRIDVQFSQPQLEVKQCTVINEKLSDHYPVIVDYKWR